MTLLTFLSSLHCSGASLINDLSLCNIFNLNFIVSFRNNVHFGFSGIRCNLNYNIIAIIKLNNHNYYATKSVRGENKKF